MHGVDIIFFILSSFVSFFLLSVYTFIISYLSNKEIYGTQLPKIFLTLVYRQNLLRSINSSNNLEAVVYIDNTTHF